MGEFVTLSWPTHFRSLLEGLWRHFQYNVHTDFEIVVNNDDGNKTSVEAHRLILSIFCPELTNITENKIVIGDDDSDINKADIHSLMEFVYRGTIKVNEGRLKQLRSGAAAIGLTIMVDLIDNFIGVKAPESLPTDVMESSVEPKTQLPKRRRKLTEAGLELQQKIRQRQTSLQARMSKRLTEVLTKSRNTRRNHKIPAEIIRDKIANYKKKAHHTPRITKDDDNNVKIRKRVGRKRKIDKGVAGTNDKSDRFKHTSKDRKKCRESALKDLLNKSPIKLKEPVLKLVRIDSALANAKTSPTKPHKKRLKRKKSNKTVKISEEIETGANRTENVETPLEGAETQPLPKMARKKKKREHKVKRTHKPKKSTEDHSYQNSPVKAKKARTRNQTESQETTKKTKGGRKVLLEVDPDDMDLEQFNLLYDQQNVEINPEKAESSNDKEVVTEDSSNDVNIEVPQNDVIIEMPQNVVSIEVSDNIILVDDPQNYAIIENIRSEALVDVPQKVVNAVPQKQVTSKSRQKVIVDKFIDETETAEQVQSMTPSERSAWLNKMMIKIASQKMNYWTCLLCGETRNGWYRQLSHIRCHINPAELLKCPHCDFVAEVTADLNRHTPSCKNGSSVNGNKSQEPKIVKCPNCAFTCATHSELALHRMDKHIAKHMCDECTELFPSKNQLIYHKLTRHSKMTHFTCQTCQFETNDSKGFKLHLKIHTEKVACSVCGKKCEPGDMKKHLKTHSSVEGSGELHCHICSFSTDTPYCLKFHLRTLHKLPSVEVEEILKRLQTPEDDD